MSIRVEISKKCYVFMIHERMNVVDAFTCTGTCTFYILCFMCTDGVMCLRANASCECNYVLSTSKHFNRMQMQLYYEL